MKELLNKPTLQKILERGLVGGCWSIHEFNKTPGTTPVLPSARFLAAHPQFEDMHYRDLDAFRRARQTNTIIFEP